uniref:NcSP22 protein n=1 Tax=Nephotettix cincticeps TaxID=94400 RepID=A0A0E4AW62_NEPCI|nr:NcSP22 [Nephotettix cincticeps]
MKYVSLLLVCLVVVAHAAHPQVEHVDCVPQNWPAEIKNAGTWQHNQLNGQHSGEAFIHQGTDKDSHGHQFHKLADFHIKVSELSGNDAAALCFVDISQDTKIEGFWMSRSNPNEETRNYVYGVGNEHQLRFGIKGLDQGPTNPQSHIEIYTSKRPNHAKITCGAGAEGKICDNTLSFIYNEYTPAK